MNKFNNIIKEGIFGNVTSIYCEKCNKKTFQRIYKDKYGFYSACNCNIEQVKKGE